MRIRMPDQTNLAEVTTQEAAQNARLFVYIPN